MTCCPGGRSGGGAVTATVGLAGMTKPGGVADLVDHDDGGIETVDRSPIAQDHRPGPPARRRARPTLR